MTDTNEYGYVIPEDTEENSYIDDTSENEGKENYDDEIAVQAVEFWVDVTARFYINSFLKEEKEIEISSLCSVPLVEEIVDSVLYYRTGSTAEQPTPLSYDFGVPIESVTITKDTTDYSYDFVAVPKKPTDLTDTEWYFNESINGFGGTSAYSNLFGSEEEDYERYKLSVDSLFASFNLYQNSLKDPCSFLLYDSESGWVKSEYRTWKITGGSDATNTTVIDWLYSNATLISAPEPITRQFTRLYKGIIPHGQANNKCFKQYSRGLNEFDVAGASSYFPNETSSITWQQWVESEYNTAGYSIDDYGYVLTASPFYGVMDGDFRKGTDTIIEGDSFGLDGERIFFRIDGKTYYSFMGYDFEWWVDSNYNTDGFYLDSDNYLNTADGKKVKDTNGEYAYGTMEAEDDTDYYSESATLISFTINISSNGVDKDYEFQAEEGMTWAEWVESDYNTDGTWTIYSNGYIQKSDTTDHTMQVSASSTVKGTVSATDVIIANHSYTYDNFGA